MAMRHWLCKGEGPIVMACEAANNACVVGTCAADSLALHGLTTSNKWIGRVCVIHG